MEQRLDADHNDSDAAVHKLDPGVARLMIWRSAWWCDPYYRYDQL
jgi:hypothetical protein